MDKFVNPECITSVKVYKKEVSKWHTYKKAHRFLFIWKRPEGIYYRKEYISTEDFKDYTNLYLENEIIYVRPYLTIHGSGNLYHARYFDTVEELDEYMHKIEISVRLINIK